MLIRPLPGYKPKPGESSALVPPGFAPDAERVPLYGGNYVRIFPANRPPIEISIVPEIIEDVDIDWEEPV